MGKPEKPFHKKYYYDVTVRVLVETTISPNEIATLNPAQLRTALLKQKPHAARTAVQKVQTIEVHGGKLPEFWRKHAKENLAQAFRDQT